MKYLKAAAQMAFVAGASGCIWSPSDHAQKESNTSITVSGYTITGGEVVTLQATNLTTGMPATVGSATTSSTPFIYFDGGALYPWTTNINPQADYWSPQIDAGGLQFGPGRIEISGTLSDGIGVDTFSPTQNTCVQDNYVSLGVIGAVSHCGHNDTLVMFDNTGDYTPPLAAGLFHLQTGTYSTANWELDSYQVGFGTGTSRTVYAFVCYPSSAGTHPVQIYNHPNYTGLFGTLTGGAPGADDLGNCIHGALNGWVTAMSSYRGEGVSGTYTESYDFTQVETCLGETTDVLRLTNLVLAQSYSNPSKVLMWGYSHGGCITDRAVEQGAPVQAAATFAAMTDVAAMTTNDCDGDNNVGCTEPFYTTNWGYTPVTGPKVYAWRSPVNFAVDLNAQTSAPTNLKTLMVQAVEYEDGLWWDTVLQPGAACELASLMSPAPVNVYMSKSTGFPLTGPPPDCTSYTGLTWQPDTINPYTWTWPNNTLLEFDGDSHQNIVQDRNAWNLFMNFVSSLGWGSTPYSTSYAFATPDMD